MSSDEEKGRGGKRVVLPGWRFPRSLLAEVGHRRPFFRRHVVVLLCGWDVAAPTRPPEAEWSSGVAAFFGGVYYQDIFKVPTKRHDHLSVLVYIIRICFPRGFFHLRATRA